VLQAENAEDAFQASSLVPARKLSTLRKRDSLASWLHGVAQRVALDSKKQAARRYIREGRASSPEARPPDDPAWSALANAALPDAVPVCREAKELFARKAELIDGGGSPGEIRAACARFDELRPRTPDQFPLTEAECADLRACLQARVQTLYEAEVAARDAMGQAIA